MRKALLSATAIVALSSSAYAADLPSRTHASLAPVAAPPVFTWTGFYAGVNVGAGWSKGNFNQSAVNYLDNYSGLDPAGVLSVAGINGTNKVASTGLLGGIQLGYNYQLNDVVVGVEGDFDFAGIRGTGNYSSYGTMNSTESPVEISQQITGGTASLRLNNFGTVRARLGLLVTPSVLAYATAGVAFADVSASNTIRQIDTHDYTSVQAAFFQYTGAPSVGSKSGMRAGFVVGGGAEYKIDAHWSLKTEALYYNLGSVTINHSDLQVTATNAASIKDHVSSRLKIDGVLARVGVNYKF